MKKVFLFLSVIAMSVLMSCTKENNQELAGQWRLIQLDFPMVQLTQDLSSNNILFNFQTDGKLIVSGAVESIGIQDGQHTYEQKNDYFSDNPSAGEQKEDLVIIDNNKFVLTFDNNKMILSQAALDGGIYTFKR